MKKALQLSTGNPPQSYGASPAIWITQPPDTAL